MRKLSKLLVCIALVLSTSTLLRAKDTQGPLKDYVRQADESYIWVKRQEGKLAGAQWAELILTSQTWKGTVWRHQLFVIRPSEVTDASQAIMLIDGGRWNDNLAKPATDETAKLPQRGIELLALAERIKSPVAILRQVPQQPIFDGMVEDAAISYTFEQFLKTRDATWPLLLPMVKSTVRGMDAVQDFAQKQWDLDIKNFTLTGASKRGWTTWLTASVDDRVNAFAPMVIDMLNMSAQMKHQVESFGKFSEQIHDYTQRGLPQQGATDAGRLLQAIVDPYAYRSMLTQPKLILLGTNDRYWPLDALNMYWDGLTGEKHILYVPNSGHSLNDMARVTGTIAALHRQACGQCKLANLTWDLTNGDGKLALKVRSDTKPKMVRAWIANAETRDFREAKWTSEPTTVVDDAYCYEMPLPESGYAAAFGEAVFETDVLPYYLSTNVKIVKGKEAE